MSIKFTMIDRVKKVEEKLARQWIRGSSENAEFEEASHGWWVTFESGNESLYLGTERPDLRAGDEVRRTVEKVQ